MTRDNSIEKPTGKMHSDEVATNISLVHRLLTAQFPQWADLLIEPVLSDGTDNAIYRLGDDMAVRLPRIHWAIEQVDKEQEWLPKLAPLLPLSITVPLAKGMPGEGYPWNWSVYKWLEGENATVDNIGDMRQTATELGRFVSALHWIDATGGPPPGTHNVNRGEPLAMRDKRTREAIATLRGQGTFDADMADEVTAAWEAALNASVWTGPPVWIHGDLQPGNLLVSNGRFSAVIDFGCLGVGDPACDMLIAWNFFSREAREVFRQAIQVDDATWERGKGWALTTALGAIPYYQDSNPEIVLNAWYRITEVLAANEA